MTWQPKPLTPIEPVSQPATCLISSSFNRRSGDATVVKLLAFTSFKLWSPRTTKATGPSTPATSRVLMVWLASTLKNADTASMVLTSGVWTFSIDCSAAARSCNKLTASHFSKLAAYSPESEYMMASSPESAITWNSWEPEPPMAPESARTQRKSSPIRLMMLV